MHVVLSRGRERRGRGAGARRPGRARRRPRALRRSDRVEVALVRRFEVVLLLEVEAAVVGLAFVAPRPPNGDPATVTPSMDAPRPPRLPG